jgi:CRISPR-associated protein Csm5
MSVYTMTLTTLTPLHIGDGDELRLGFDFKPYKGRTYRLDEDQVLQAKEHKLKPNARGDYPLPGELLDEQDFNKPGLFRYILRGTPSSEKRDARMSSFIKDVYDRPYIPGSSLKGALRTALAWNGWEEVELHLNRNAIGRRRNWAGQKLEQKLFGRNPNHDLLRALQVSDLFGPEKPGQGLVVTNALVLLQRKTGSPIELEALKGDVQFEGTVKIDDTLFEPWAERELGFANRRHWLDELMPRTQRHSLARINKLQPWFEDAQGGARIAAFYRKLSQVSLKPNQALIQLGWGTGWDDKTFGSRLQEDQYLFSKIVKDFRLSRGRRQPGDDFPRSKRVAVQRKDNKAFPIAPFGWALLEMEPAR